VTEDQKEQKRHRERKMKEEMELQIPRVQVCAAIEGATMEIT